MESSIKLKLDLDLNLIMPDGCSTSFYKTKCYTKFGNSSFENDKRGGTGPETITFTIDSNWSHVGESNGSFFLYVFNSVPHQSFVNSNAIVKLYKGNGLVKEI